MTSDVTSETRREFEVKFLSAAESSFELEASPQIDRLLKIHEEIGGSGRGRRHNLEVLNKSAIVLTCAFWEAFVEDLAAEVLEHFAREASSAELLPLELRKSVAKELASAKHELSSWELAGDGWRAILRARAAKIKDGEDRTLSTPNSRNVETFFCNQAGISSLTSCWYWPKATVLKNRERLDEFVKLRNAIAHRGGPTDATVLKKDARDGLNLVNRLAKLSISYVNKKVADLVGVDLVPPPMKFPLI
ncbi:HEPN domain-containing protein [Micromonospora sp. U21]|uniref:HEPN domain-containing protein n=1 Tax=Micromonospora sp. U21 TaxID=2824899 RepID=UPI001B3669B4|nr:HEPN domain-containing protein [Micromonospora sp. U21]MBQ0903580.1 hypothetical protein [Micromonospora sp. U21]